MADPMDERLARAGARWRDSVDLTPVDVESAVIARRRAWPHVLAAAAAVVLVVLVVVLIQPGHDQTAPPAPQPASIVPWRPLPPTHPTIPEVRIPPSPAPAPPGTPTCRADQVRVVDTGMGAAAGTEYISPRFRLVGTRPCALAGRPSVVPLSQGRPVTGVPVHAGPDVQGWRATDPVLLDTTHSARVTIAWAASHYCGPAVDVDQLRLGLPGLGRDFVVRGFGRTYCEPGESGRTPITVGPLSPAVSRPGETRPIYAPIRAGRLPTTAPAGHPVDFQVTLTVPHTIVLDPCPDYTIEAFAFSGPARGKHTPTKWSHALNCAGIPTRDDQGRPALRPHRPVTFAMRAPALAAGQYKFIWELEPGEAVAGGVLTVTRNG